MFMIVIYVFLLKVTYHPALNYELPTPSFQQKNFHKITPVTEKASDVIKFITSKGVAYSVVVKPNVSLDETEYQPYQLISYKLTGENDDRSVYVVPRRAYIDNRLAHEKPKNTLRILAEVHDYAVKSVVACELNGFVSTSIRVIKESTGWVRSHYPSFTHCGMLVQCVGLPEISFVNGTFPNLIYKMYKETFYSVVRSEKPLILDSIETDTTKIKGTVVLCAMMYGHPEKFNHWLTYQKTIGVDKVHLSVEHDFMNNATQLYPFLNESLMKGFVDIEVWEDIVGKRIYYYGKIIKYQDCIFRHMNRFEYLFVYDYDDYFNPMLPDHKDVHYYLNKFFAKSNIGTVHMTWHQMKCAPIEEKCKTLQDGNLTSVLSGPQWYRRSEAKCAHRLKAVVFLHSHSSLVLLSGYLRSTASDKLAYVAHNRYTNKHCSR